MEKFGQLSYEHIDFDKASKEALQYIEKMQNVGNFNAFKNAVHEFETFKSIQRLRLYAKTLEVVEQIRFHSLQTGLRSFQTLRLNAEGQILGLYEAVVTSGKLVLEHFRVFCANVVKLVALRRNDNVPGIAVSCGCTVDEGELKSHGAVKIVDEVTPCVKDSGFVLVLVELVVDVLKLDGFRVIVVCDTANTVR